MRSFFELDWETLLIFALQWEALFVVVEYQEVERFELLQQILMMTQLLVVFEVQRWTQLLVIFWTSVEGIVCALWVSSVSELGSAPADPDDDSASWLEEVLGNGMGGIVCGPWVSSGWALGSAPEHPDDDSAAWLEAVLGTGDGAGRCRPVTKQ
jgi:hypothetical protein